MAYKIFLDTNIVADFLDEERNEHLNAIELFREIENGIVEAYFSESVVNTTSYILRKLISVDVFKILMNELTGYIKILPCSNNIVQQAYQTAKNDLGDAVLYQIALHHRLNYFVTSDVKDFRKIQHPLLPVVTAKKIVEIIK